MEQIWKSLASKGRALYCGFEYCAARMGRPRSGAGQINRMRSNLVQRFRCWLKRIFEPLGCGRLRQELAVSPTH